MSQAFNSSIFGNCSSHANEEGFEISLEGKVKGIGCGPEYLVKAEVYDNATGKKLSHQEIWAKSALVEFLSDKGLDPNDSDFDMWLRGRV